MSRVVFSHGGCGSLSVLSQQKGEILSLSYCSRPLPLAAVKFLVLWLKINPSTPLRILSPIDSKRAVCEKAREGGSAVCSSQ